MIEDLERAVTELADLVAHDPGLAAIDGGESPAGGS